MNEHVNIHILLSLLWDCVHTAVCEKVSSAHRGECVTTGGLYRPTHLCVAHLNCTKKFFFGVVRLSTSALVSEILVSVLQTVQKKTKNNLHIDSTYLQTVQKTMCKIHIHILNIHSVL